MKYQLLLFLLTINTLFVTAQDFEKTFQDQPLMYGNIIQPLDNGDILVAAVAEGDLSEVKIYRLDSVGNIIWILTHTLDSSDRYAMDDIMVTDENEAYIVLTHYTCDIGGTWSIIVRIDLETGTMLCDSYDFTLFSSDQPINFIFTLPTGYKNFVMLDDSSLLLITSDGNFLVSESCQLTESEGYSRTFDDVLKIDDNHFIGVGSSLFEGSSYGLLTYPDIENSNIITTTKNYIKVVQAPDGNFLMLHTEGLDKIDASLNILTSTLFTDFNQVVDLAIFEENIFLAGKMGSSTVIATYDQNLNWISNFIVGNSLITPLDLIINENQLLLTGALNDGSNATSTAWVKSVAIDALNNPTRPDVGIVDLSFNGLVYDGGFFCLPSLVDVTLENVVVTIKNFGAMDVINLNVSALFGSCNICNINESFTMELENVNLLAGEEREIVLGDLFANVINTSAVQPYELCMWTSIPDNKIDANPTNNTHCTITDNIILPTTEFQNNINWEIFPNPVNDNFNIEYHLEEAKEVSFQLYNVLGQEVYSTAPTFQTSGTHQDVISISEIGLENGIYILLGTFGEELVSEPLHVLGN